MRCLPSSHIFYLEALPPSPGSLLSSPFKPKKPPPQLRLHKMDDKLKLDSTNFTLSFSHPQGVSLEARWRRSPPCPGQPPHPPRPQCCPPPAVGPTDRPLAPWPVCRGNTTVTWSTNLSHMVKGRHVTSCLIGCQTCFTMPPTLPPVCVSPLSVNVWGKGPFAPLLLTHGGGWMF